MGTMVVERRPGGTQIRYTGLALPRLPAAMRDSAQAAMIDTVLHWRARFGPRHFEVEAYDRYGGREPRVYEERKHRSGPHKGQRKRPLVKTGNLRTAFLTGAVRVQATGSGRTLKVRANWPALPRHAYYDKTRFGKPSHKKHLELTIMDESEERKLAAFFRQALAEYLEKEGD